MESLLRWGVENSTPSDGTNPPAPPADPKKLDPEIIDMILGKSDAVLMKEAMATAINHDKSEDERVQALDDLEMLVEQIDNANNLERLDMWHPLHNLLSVSSSTDAIKIQALWVIGTALQNNPSAQLSYLGLNPLPNLLRFLAPTTPPSPKELSRQRSKALYALSGLLKHNAPAVARLESLHGWDALADSLTDPDFNVRRKTAFLLSALLIHVEALPSTSSTRTSATGTGANLHAPGGRTTAVAPFSGASESDASETPSAPVHPNSHASHLSDPSSVDTSSVALRGILTQGSIVAALARCLKEAPEGADVEDVNTCLQRISHALEDHAGQISELVVSVDDREVLRRFNGIAA